MEFLLHFLAGLLGIWCDSEPVIVNSIKGDYVKTGQFSVHKPSFLSIFENEHKEYTLFISSFQVFGQDHIYEINNLEKLAHSQIQPSDVIDKTTKINWPNEISNPPIEIWGPGFKVVAGGFLTPFKSNGFIELFNEQTGEVQHITKPKNGYFYHRVRYIDVNGDGKLDILTARAHKGVIPFVDHDASEFLVLLQPQNPFNTWTEKILISGGPDIFFEPVDLDNDGVFEIIAGQFFNEKVTYHYFDNVSSLWVEKVIDDSIGPIFDVTIQDINNDGKRDLIVTDHSPDKKVSGVYAYEIPKDPINSEWKKHILHKGFITRNSGPGQASPGDPVIFYPHRDNVGKSKPYISLSGDGSQKLYLLRPKSENSNDWTYEIEDMLIGNATIGKQVVLDVDDDGFAEIYCPIYEHDTVYIISFTK